MERISRHKMFMEIAEVVSKRSTCMRRNVGAIITHGNNIISIGYNGAPPGNPHCFGRDCVPPGTKGGCLRAVHAELNAIERLPNIQFRHDVVMYVTESPCPECANRILSMPISALYYQHLYRILEGVDTVASHIPVFRMTPSGYLIDHLTGVLIDAA